MSDRIVMLKKKIQTLRVEYEKHQGIASALIEQISRTEIDLAESVILEKYGITGFDLDGCVFEFLNGNKYITYNNLLYRVKGVRKKVVSQAHSGNMCYRYEEIASYLGRVKIKIGIDHE